MRNWHPISKVAIVIGVSGLAIVWWLEYGPAGDAQVAEAVQSSANETVRAAPVASLPRAPTGSVEPSAGTRALPPVNAFESMVDRPLFAPARRPLDPNIEVAELDFTPWTVEPEASLDYPAVDFIGSIEENGSVRALLGNGFNVRGVALGDVVDGWTVLAIDARRLTLGFEDETIELTILE